VYTWGCPVLAFGLRAFKMDIVVGKNGQAYFSTACWSLELVGSDRKYWTFWRQVCYSSTCDFRLNQTFSGRSAVRALSDVTGLLSVADTKGAHTRTSLARKSGWARVSLSQTRSCVECHEPDSADSGLDRQGLRWGSARHRLAIGSYVCGRSQARLVFPHGHKHRQCEFCH
jgi:hypothetical protein